MGSFSSAVSYTDNLEINNHPDCIYSTDRAYCLSLTRPLSSNTLQAAYIVGSNLEQRFQDFFIIVHKDAKL